MAVGHNVTLRKGRYGNATLSRHPILRERNIDLTIGTWKRRGCQHTAIALNGHVGRSHRLEVFNLHLGLSARQREQQVALLARSRELASLATDVACLVGGDFNDWRSLLQPLFTGAAAVPLRHRALAERRAADPHLPVLLPQGSPRQHLLPRPAQAARGAPLPAAALADRQRPSSDRRRLRDPLTPRRSGPELPRHDSRRLHDEPLRRAPDVAERVAGDEGQPVVGRLREDPRLPGPDDLGGVDPVFDVMARRPDPDPVVQPDPPEPAEEGVAVPREDDVSRLTRPRGPRNVPDGDGQRGVVVPFPDDRRDARPGGSRCGRERPGRSAQRRLAGRAPSRRASSRIRLTAEHPLRLLRA